MEEISLKFSYLPWSPTSNFNGQAVDITREPYLEEIVKRVDAGEQVFVKFGKKHHKRPGAIALVKKITGEAMNASGSWHRAKYSSYKFHLKWDDRKNTAKVDTNHNELFYLPDYDGKTVWSMFDAKEFAKKNAKKIRDRLGKEIKEGDVVIYINARYGSGAMIDFGVVQKIAHKASRDYRGSSHIESIVHIETIITNEGDAVVVSKISRPNRSVMVMTDVDLFDEAFVAKLTITQ